MYAHCGTHVQADSGKHLANEQGGTLEQVGEEHTRGCKGKNGKAGANHSVVVCLRDTIALTDGRTQWCGRQQTGAHECCTIRSTRPTQTHTDTQSRDQREYATDTVGDGVAGLYLWRMSQIQWIVATRVTGVHGGYSGQCDVRHWSGGGNSSMISDGEQ